MAASSALRLPAVNQQLMDSAPMSGAYGGLGSLAGATCPLFPTHAPPGAQDQVRAPRSALEPQLGGPEAGAGGGRASKGGGRAGGAGSDAHPHAALDQQPRAPRRSPPPGEAGGGPGGPGEGGPGRCASPGAAGGRGAAAGPAACEVIAAVAPHARPMTTPPGAPAQPPPADDGALDMSRVASLGGIGLATGLDAQLEALAAAEHGLPPAGVATSSVGSYSMMGSPYAGDYSTAPLSPLPGGGWGGGGCGCARGGGGGRGVRARAVFAGAPPAAGPRGRGQIA
jgi:hypothetical protein